MQGAQVSSQWRTEIQSGQDAEWDKPGFQVFLRGSGFAACRKSGEENEVHAAACRARCQRLQDKHDPAGYHRQPGLLKDLAPGAGSHALTRIGRSAGKHPVVGTVAGTVHEQHVTVAEHDNRAADIDFSRALHGTHAFRHPTGTVGIRN